MNAVAEAVKVAISPKDLFTLCAEDSLLYSQTFFSRAVRQDSPSFHKDIWRAAENPTIRYLNLKIFRGGAKTTLARIILSKRIAYGISRTILVVGKSEGAAARSIDWLMGNIEYNTQWAQFYGLEKGNKWTNTECEIYHRGAGHTVRVIALGITGSLRGINVDDFRPDFIMVDDPCDEENTATAEGRHKIEKFFFGAIAESLAPYSECPEAMLMLLQTPLEEGDLTDICSKDPTWVTLTYACLTSEDENEAESMWPSRWSKEELIAAKHAAMARNQLSMWLREKMCLMTTPELCTFDVNWLQYWKVLPPGARYFGAIDPAPVLSDRQRQKLVQTTDYQAMMVKCYWQRKTFIVDYTMERDEDPDAVINFMYNMNRKYPIMRWGVEGVAYQRTLKWFIERQIKMGKLQPKQIVELSTRTDKFQRIVQSHTDRASSGLLYVHETHHEFIQQFTTYSKGSKYKDLLDVSALCDETISPALEGAIEGDYSDLTSSEEEIPALEYTERCP